MVWAPAPDARLRTYGGRQPTLRARIGPDLAGWCRGDGAAGIMGAVNYEDRTDLLPPDQVVSSSLLLKLQRTAEASRLMTLSLDDPSPSVSSAAYEVILLRVVEDTAPGSGAPAQARAVEEDAMLCGYRFGRLALVSRHRRSLLAWCPIRSGVRLSFVMALRWCGRLRCWSGPAGWTAPTAARRWRR